MENGASLSHECVAGRWIPPTWAMMGGVGAFKIAGDCVSDLINVNGCQAGTKANREVKVELGSPARHTRQG